MLEPRKRRNREHKNSRNGCLQCKARKVKCDENKPKCNSCSRRSTPCTFPNESVTTRSSSRSPSVSVGVSLPTSVTSTPQTPIVWQSVNTAKSNAAPGLSSISSQLQNGGQSSSNLNRGYSLTPAHSSVNLNMVHLELFHHFATAISVGEMSQEMWSTIIPQIALSHQFLMHALLAISAVHIAHIKSAQRDFYWEQASNHEDEALRIAQKEIRNPNASNADALFAFSIPTTWYSFASHVLPHSGGDRRPLQSTIKSINLLRGIRTVGPSVKQWVSKGALAPMLALSPENFKSAQDFTEPETSAYFSKLLVFCSTMSGDTELEDQENFAAAATSLRTSYLKVEAIPEGEPSSPPIWHWAIRLQAGFVERLSELHVVPLVLVAHWCVLLARVRHFWWMEGWVEKTMSEIESCISEEHRRWLHWPLMRISQIGRKGMKADMEQ